MNQKEDTRIDVLCVGHAAYDLTFAVDRHPGSDEKTTATAMAACGGGPAANAAVAAARFGGRAAFAGYLGDDDYGRKHLGSWPPASPPEKSGIGACAALLPPLP